MPQAPTRIKSLLILALLLASWQFCASAHAQTLSARCRASSAIDDVDCITATAAAEEPAQECDDPSDLPNDFDISANPWVDRAVLPSSTDQDPPHFAQIGFAAAPLRSPLFICVREPERSPCTSYSHEQIRERAPPGVV